MPEPQALELPLEVISQPQLQRLPLPPLSLYIHIPWCIRKCPYCDFNSHAVKETLPEHIYVKTLLADLHTELATVANRPLQSIFIGGGTPSLFSGQAIDDLLTGIRQVMTVVPEIEITLEANPGTVEQQRFKDFYQAGINRISLGVQSFQNDLLAKLGRIHDGDAAKKAVIAAQNAGFKRINIDLMHGLPQQTLAQALQDLQLAIALAPGHLSWYQLTVEPNTYFHRFPPVLPDDELIAVMQEQGQALLAAANYQQYEISAYSQPQQQCRHNIQYWQFNDYLGIGAGAHGKISDLSQQTIQRYSKIKNPRDYLAAKENWRATENIVAAKDLPFEFMLNALRLYQPIALSNFEQTCGLPAKMLSPILIKAQQKGLLDFDEQYITPTSLGRRFYNDLVEMFLPEL